MQELGMRRLWMGVLLAPGAWLVNELIGYLLAARACGPLGGLPFRVAVEPRVLHVTMAAVLAATAAMGLVIAVKNWRSAPDDPTTGDPPARGRVRFMSLAGVIVSSLFLLGIVFFAIPGFVVQACSQVRGP